MNDGIQLYDTQGRRLYLSSAERDAFLDVATQADRSIRTLCSVFYYTGCRILEALALTAHRIDINDQTISFETLKKRRRGVCLLSRQFTASVCDLHPWGNSTRR